MIEKYFKMGVRFQWQKPSNVDGPRDGIFVNSRQPTTPMTYLGLGEIVEPSLMFQHVSSIGLQMRTPITPHQWLDYVPGRTAQVPQGPYDVLTGFMSGCIIARWMKNGVTYVGHVGTVEADAGVNRVVKRKFGFDMPKGTTGFDPFGAWSNDVVPLAVNLTSKLKKVMDPKICALVSTSGEFFSIILFPDGPNQWYCGGIKRVPPISHDTLKLRMMHD